jgi:hypothetical protein
MREWYTRHRFVIWWVAVAGVPIGYLGMWLDVAPLMWTGIVLATPLFLVVLPFCVFLVVMYFTCPLWHPFYRLAIKWHGAPFRKGDMVRILRGRHKGKVVRVYQVWDERNEVRVELGEKEKGDFTDVFGFLSVRRL